MKNREIKFRAWTGSAMEYRVMVGFLGAFYVEGIHPLDSASMSNMNTKYDQRHVPVMQYTGLKDKNGKEIYEGDLFMDEEDGTYEQIEWDSETAGWAIKKWFVNLMEYANQLEVVGNIYENPDLIK